MLGTKKKKKILANMPILIRVNHFYMSQPFTIFYNTISPDMQ